MTATVQSAEQDTARRDQVRLFRLNRSVPDADGYREILELEEKLFLGRAKEIEAAAPKFGSRGELIKALGEFLATEQAAPSDSDRYLAEETSLAEFKEVVAQFAVDGLIESQSLLAVIPRLPARSRMAVFRVLIDEFGCGNDDQEHAKLYRNLLAELDMPTDLDSYVERATDGVLAFVNLFYWLAARAPAPDYFLGAYSYFESSVLYAFRSFEAASKRLGIGSGQYYSEHLYIDAFHSKQMQTAIRELDTERGVDYAKVWAGIELTSAIVAEAVDAAVARARSVA
ncbi:iron-containing redox enzyme family protein [Solihabitans fulvus]|uniref:Iron-containing redox enzyme family protein n=1 Tax=Solihabitans fulvus TaxID=1892852 RepID=A0A5B2X751_9PSEU|nr:iron-containing redox enzyme family protein [Solihabitans fulvus]KAA2258722.1 iron-containing redox enzyme family protein [Solihabitans fulvus]